jgi:mono/diheme cytochrome c family protein
MRYFIPIFIILIVTAISILGYRGNHSKNTPIEVFPDMDRQAKYKPQTINERFADKQADRLPVPNTRVRGNLLDLGNVFSSSPDLMTAEVRTGKTSTGEWVAKIPTDAGIDMSLMRLGKERYDIHCAICHGEYGNGRGATAQFGLAPRNLSDPSQSGTYLENAAPWLDGQIYNAITNGSNSQLMLGLGDKLSPKERWAIVLYVRALQSYVGTATESKKGKDS